MRLTHPACSCLAICKSSRHLADLSSRSGEDIVRMYMQIHLLPPRMQRLRDTGQAAELVFHHLEDSVLARGDQQTVHIPRVTQCIKLMRQRKDGA